MSANLNTYIMFTQKGGERLKVIGPFFYSERDMIKRKCFTSDEEDVRIIEETMFAAHYPDQYFEHIQKAWLDKMYCYFALNSWVGKVNISTRRACCEGSWFHLFEMIDDKGYVYYQLNISIEANKFHAAKLKQDLLDMDFMSIKLGEPFYQDKTGVIYVHNALTRYLADELCEHACLQ